MSIHVNLDCAPFVHSVSNILKSSDVGFSLYMIHVFLKKIDVRCVSCPSYGILLVL